jgi:hypothetical protein
MTQSFPPDSDARPPGRPARWLDTTISLQNLLVWILGGVLALGWMSYQTYTGMTDNIKELKASDKAQNDHFTRIESAMQDQRSDTREQLRNIGADVKDLSSKLDWWKDQMINNSAGNRPETRKWSK